MPHPPNCPATKSSSALMRLAKSGDAAALGELLDAHRGYLRILARLQVNGRMQSKVDASDVVQEAFLGAHRDFAQFRGATPGEFAGWLRQVMAHVIANQVRRYQGTRQRDVRLEQRLEVSLDRSSMALEWAFVAPGPSPSQEVVGKEMGVVVAAALERMEATERELLLLRHVEDMSFPRIAERLSRSVDSVKRMWPRALGRFRRLVEQFHHPPAEVACE